MKNLTNRLAGGIGIILCGCLASCADPYFFGPAEPVTQYRTGYEVQTLPSGYRTEVISGTRYYVYGNTYYQPRSGRYVVVESPRRIDRPRYDDGRYDDRRYDDRRYDDRRYDDRRTVVIQELPSGYRTETYRGARYYRVNDVYYRQSGNGYIIVERPY